MKKCPTCKTEKPETEFYKRSNVRAGRDNVCKVCREKRVRELSEEKKTVFSGQDWTKLFIGCFLILLSSCTRYQWVATETKISTVGQKIHIEPIGKPVPIGDTTIRGYLITKHKN